jgi:hypothetical protein
LDDLIAIVGPRAAKAARTVAMKREGRDARRGRSDARHASARRRSFRLWQERSHVRARGWMRSMVVVADGTEAAAKRLERVLTIDPGMGTIRHADAGYETAERIAKERSVRIPHHECFFREAIDPHAT